jgi:hypothetical protein
MITTTVTMEATETPAEAMETAVEIMATEVTAAFMMGPITIGRKKEREIIGTTEQIGTEIAKIIILRTETEAITAGIMTRKKMTAGEITVR